MSLFDNYLQITLESGSDQMICYYNLSTIKGLDNSLDKINYIISIINFYNSFYRDKDRELILAKVFMESSFETNRGYKAIPSMNVDTYKYFVDKYPDEDFNYDFGGIIQLAKYESEILEHTRNAIKIVINFDTAKINFDLNEVNEEDYAKKHEGTDLSKIAVIEFDVEAFPIIELETFKELLENNHNDLFYVNGDYYTL